MPVASTTTAPALILRARKALDLSQRELAARMGVTEQTVRRWERGISLITFLHLTNVAKLAEKVDAALAAEMREAAGSLAKAMQVPRDFSENVPPPTPTLEITVLDRLVAQAAQHLGVTVEALTPVLIALLEEADHQNYTLRKVWRGLKAR